MARTKKDPKPKKNGVAAPLRLDLGCGPNKKDGFIGVDIRQFDGKVDFQADLSKEFWTFDTKVKAINGLKLVERSTKVKGSTRVFWTLPNDSVDEVHCSHMVEHLEWPERVHFFNELHRVMKKGAKALIITPHWASARYYGDPTHKSPFSEWAWFYMDAEWRKNNAPHTDYVCDFTHSYSYGLHPALAGRNPESINYAITFYKDACTDMICTLMKK